jgi:hypothetical protein
MIQNWDLLMVFLLAYTTFWTTYQCSFPNADEWSGQTGVVCDNLVMVGFFLDIAKNFNLAYESEESRAMITSRRLIAKRYAKSWFLLDLGSTIPWDSLGLIGGSSPRLLRLLRLTKLARLLRANQILTKVMKHSSMKMSSFAFMRTIIMVVVVVHWSSCVWMMIGRADMEVGWTSAFVHKPNGLKNSLTGNSSTMANSSSTMANSSRRLKNQNAPSYNAGVRGDSEEGGGISGILPLYGSREGDGPLYGWYALCIEFSLATLGIWPYDAPEPITQMEHKFTLLFVFVAATIYAWLAGVIVELVSRVSENTRDVDGIYDALVEYMDAIDFPTERRQKFLRFFWVSSISIAKCDAYSSFFMPHLPQNSKKYLRQKAVEGKLPNLSERLTGELVKFNHGAEVSVRVSVYQCISVSVYQCSISGLV